MRDVLDDLVGWWQAGETVGVGTVVGTWRSAPRPPGASMLVGPDGTAVGSVSGGCVEGAVYELAKDAVETGAPALQRYGVSDDDAFAVGLTCGGIIDVFVEPISRESSPSSGRSAASTGRHEPVAVVTVVEGPDDRLGPAAGALAGPRRPARSGCSGWTTPSPTTPAACSPPGGPGCCTTATTASAAARAWRCSSPPSRRRPG